MVARLDVQMADMSADQLVVSSAAATVAHWAAKWADEWVEMWGHLQAAL